jgi:tetratricopeptide (TPR) repeat protein
VDRQPSAESVFWQAFRSHQQGKLTEAEELYRTALQLDPNSAAAHHNLGTLLAQGDHSDEAIAHFEKAIALRPDSAESRTNLANALARLNRLDQSIAEFEKVLEISRRQAEPYLRACYNIGVSLQAAARHEAAIAHYRRAIAIDPDYAEAHNALGNALTKCRREQEALAHYERFAAIRPELAEAQNNLGVALHAANREAEAIARFANALAIKPDYPDAYGNLGLALESLGRIKEATQAYEMAIEGAPTVVRFYRWLFHCTTAVAGDRHVVRLMELTDRAASLPRQEEIELRFAAGKIFADLKRYDLSFSHLQVGNALKRKEAAYDESRTLSTFDRLQAIFTPQFMQARQGRGNRSAKPIFIVGMPRSGSTLVEQMLASHPLVFGAGEAPELNRAVGQLVGQKGSEVPFPEQLRTLADEDLAQLGHEYLRGLRIIAPDAERVTDKSLSNFRFAGLIHLALPNARIIHIRRDPIDTCVSCFATLFARGQHFTYDLGELGRYYRAYERLMDHWRAVLPDGVMLELRYEELIANFEDHARRILAYCGLAWDEACLHFYRTQRPVKTASAPQVYQPIYKSSVGRGSYYGDSLRPLLDALRA